MNNFERHIEKFVGSQSIDDLQGILSYFEEISIKKKELLLEADMLCDKLFFVEQGCLRSYYIKGNGTEQTIDFAIENWWLTDNMAFEHHSNSGFYIQSVEKCKVLVISRNNFLKLLVDYPIMEKYFRQVFQRAYAAAQYRLKYLYEFSREELYFHFEERFPEFIQRIPQYLMASYLGFSPEYLSEIKKKRFS